MILLLNLSRHIYAAAKKGSLLRTISPTASLSSKALPARIKIPESDIEESFLKGSGPGGQKIVGFAWIKILSYRV
jgi:hypothetical protein